MKKLLIITLILFVQLMYAGEHYEGYGTYKYYNSDGSLDWDTFYAKWDEVPDNYYIYLFFVRWNRNINANPILIKKFGGITERTRNQIYFTYEGRSSKLEIIFSPLNYSNAEISVLQYIRIGQKRNNYGEAINQWNFMLKNVE